MKLELKSFVATDGVKLPSLLFTPDKPTNKVVVWLHGMQTSIFYNSTWINAIGQKLTDKGTALLAFNNRGADNDKRLRLVAEDVSDEEGGRFQGGSLYELIADCVHDVDGAVAHLKDRGFNEFYLAGHSTGANKICVYDNLSKHNVFSKYVMAGPGDDVGIFFAELGSKKYWAALQQAAKITKDDPFKVMPKYSGMHPFSAQSAWDILNPDGNYNTFPYYEAKTQRLGSKELFKEYKAIKLPTLVIYGEEDEYAFTAGGAKDALDILMSQTSNQMLKVNDFMLIPFADHSFHDAETEFAERMAEWLA